MDVVWPWDTAPIVWAEPEPDSPEAFDEDDFVALWNEWYSLLFKVGHFRPEDVIFPPKDTGRHANLPDTGRLYGELGLSPEAVSLIERLPYSACEGEESFIFLEAEVLNYLRPRDLSLCRDPHRMAEFSTGISDDPPSSTDGIYLLPHDVALTLPYEGEGWTFILDLKYNAFRLVERLVEYPDRGHHSEKFYLEPRGPDGRWPDWPAKFRKANWAKPDDFGKRTPLERPNDVLHYRNWAPYHAPSLIKHHMRQMFDCTLIAFDNTFFVTSCLETPILGKALRRYGWPDNFQETAWIRDLDGIKQALDNLRETYEGFDDEREVLLVRWHASPDLVPDLILDSSE